MVTESKTNYFQKFIFASLTLIMSLSVFFPNNEAFAENTEQPPEPQYNENGVMQPTPNTEISPLIDQLPNADVLLANFSGVTGVGLTSNYCTATQSHINLRINNTGSSNIGHWLQTRDPGGEWVTHGNLATETSSGNYYTYNQNAIQGRDYRIMYQPRIPGITISGLITCF